MSTAITRPEIVAISTPRLKPPSHVSSVASAAKITQVTMVPLLSAAPGLPLRPTRTNWIPRKLASMPTAQRISGKTT